MHLSGNLLIFEAQELGLEDQALNFQLDRLVGDALKMGIS